jgi:hypothetical protein
LPARIETNFFVIGDGLRAHVDVMARTAGLLILKRGEIALERYGMGNDPESRWTRNRRENILDSMMWFGRLVWTPGLSIMALQAAARENDTAS